MLHIFQYNNASGQVELEKGQILLIREFAALMDDKRNVCTEDKTGKKHLRAYREFTYIYLAIDWESFYKDYTEQDRHQEALRDAHLTEEEWNDPTFRAACRKYKEMQDKSIIGSLLQSQYNLIHKMKIKYDAMDLDERKEDGTPIHKIKDVLAEMANISKSLDGLKELEEMYKKEQEAESSLRGDHEPGMFDR